MRPMSNDSRSPEPELTQAEYERRLTEMQKEANIVLAQRREAQDLVRIYREVVAAAAAYIDDSSTTNYGALRDSIQSLRERPDYL